MLTKLVVICGDSQRSLKSLIVIVCGLGKGRGVKSWHSKSITQEDRSSLITSHTHTLKISTIMVSGIMSAMLILCNY